MTKVETSEQDLHSCAGEYETPATDGVTENLTGFEAMDEVDQIVEMGTIKEKGLLWLDEDDDVNQNQDSLLDEASIFYNDFPPLPDFSCMSSSSSSPSTPAAAKPPASAGSSALSSSQQLEDGGVKSMEMENLQYIDLVECNEMWDPSSIFQSEDQAAAASTKDGLASLLEGNIELSLMFFEWLKQNKDHISAEDMRTIKLRRSTIESATRRLGTNKEGQKMLLKLILDWVKQHQLKKRRTAAANPNPNPNFIYSPLSPDPSACFSPWMGGYDPYSTPYPSPMAQQVPYQGMESWGMMQQQQQQQFNHVSGQTVYGNPYPTLVRLGPSATKEARRKRMDHQRRLHHHHPYRHNRNQTTTGNVPPRGVVDHVGENVKLWSAGGEEVAAAGEPGGGTQKQASDRRQQQAADHDLKLLLQKVLKQSDVGNLGRIVLPKKEAETHLPELDTRDGITIPMEDIGTSRVWNMRYRFWPNNKSRMYLLENTGDFVRVNGLQEGDFIVLYSDTKCGKYMIRGVKVPEPGTKPECKKATKRNGRNLSLAGINISSSPVPIRKAAI